MRFGNLACAILSCGLLTLIMAQAATSQTTNFINQNFTGGPNNLSYSGMLHLGDVDNLPFEIIPASDGTADVAYEVFWEEGSSTLPYTQYLNINFYYPRGFVGGGGGGTDSGTRFVFEQDVPLLTHLSVWSTTPQPAGLTPPTGSTVAGNYSIINLHGLNGTIVLGTVPEPGSIALLIGMGLSGAGFLARRRKNARHAA